jgi:hypothetical protein
VHIKELQTKKTQFDAIDKIAADHHPRPNSNETSNEE